MPAEPQKGDKVSWPWGGGNPGGEVAQTKKEGEIAIQSKRGNTIKKNASPDNPAVHVKRSGNDVVKRASELNIEKKGSGGAGEKRKKEEDKSGEKKKKDEGVNGLEKNEEGKDVKAGSMAKKQKRADDKEKETNGEKKDDKKDAAQQKKTTAAPAKKKEEKKKTSKPRDDTGVSSRTRSRA